MTRSNPSPINHSNPPPPRTAPPSLPSTPHTPGAPSTRVDPQIHTVHTAPHRRRSLYSVYTALDRRLARHTAPTHRAMPTGRQEFAVDGHVSPRRASADGAVDGAAERVRRYTAAKLSRREDGGYMHEDPGMPEPAGEMPDSDEGGGVRDGAEQGDGEGYDDELDDGDYDDDVMFFCNDPYEATVLSCGRMMSLAQWEAEQSDTAEVRRPAQGVSGARGIASPADPIEGHARDGRVERTNVATECFEEPPYARSTFVESRRPRDGAPSLCVRSPSSSPSMRSAFEYDEYQDDSDDQDQDDSSDGDGSDGGFERGHAIPLGGADGNVTAYATGNLVYHAYTYARMTGNTQYTTEQASASAPEQPEPIFPEILALFSSYLHTLEYPPAGTRDSVCRCSAKFAQGLRVHLREYFDAVALEEAGCVEEGLWPGASAWEGVVSYLRLGEAMFGVRWNR